MLLFLCPWKGGGGHLEGPTKLSCTCTERNGPVPSSIMKVYVTLSPSLFLSKRIVRLNVSYSPVCINTKNGFICHLKCRLHLFTGKFSSHRLFYGYIMLAMQEISSSSYPIKCKLHINYNQSETTCKFNFTDFRWKVHFTLIKINLNSNGRIR